MVKIIIIVIIIVCISCNYMLLSFVIYYTICHYDIMYIYNIRLPHLFQTLAILQARLAVPIPAASASKRPPRWSWRVCSVSCHPRHKELWWKQHQKWQKQKVVWCCVIYLMCFLWRDWWFFLMILQTWCLWRNVMPHTVVARLVPHGRDRSSRRCDLTVGLVG